MYVTCALMGFHGLAKRVGSSTVSDSSDSHRQGHMKMKHRRLGILLSTLAACGLVIGALAINPAQAKRLKAKIYLTQAKIPRKLSERGLIGFARKHRAKRLRETTAKELDKRKWRGSMVVSFNAPVGDTEFSVLFYDVEGAPRLVEDMSTFVSDRKQKTFVQKFSLPRPRFKPNRNMELVVTVRRQEVGRYKFGVLGEAKRHSGVVSFGDNER